KLSGTYNSAVSAAQEFGPERFLLWDGNTISMGSGWQALVAARLLDGGVSGADLVATLTRVRDAMVGYAALDTLKYAALSGRVGNVQAGLGNLLHIKPILEIRDGRVDAISRARGRKRSLREIVERFSHDLAGQPVNVAVQHANAADDAAALADELRQRLDVRDLTSGDIG
ncbi:MAG: DegV family EDD domain-containing protein, partial [Caldilineaceae bacterium]|nr:DegV family EDD domain-containing protein [Caldilineaceae bacterium]